MRGGAPDDGPGPASRPTGRAASVSRRLKTIPAVVVGFVLFTIAAPLVVALTVVIDATRSLRRRGPWMATRLSAFLWVYLSAQVWGLAWMFASWVASGFGAAGDRLERATYRVQGLWARYLFAAVRGVFSMDLRVEGDDAVTPGGAVYMSRHASLIDTLLPSVLITSRRGIRLRYVLKRELLADPALDVAGNRIPNYFVDRSAGGGAQELAGIAALAEGLRNDEGILIYPEGTRFRPERQEQLVGRLAGDPELGELAASLRHVHPPRPGGALALLEARTDVVFVAHAGLDGFARVADVWDGAFVGKTVRVRFRRVDASDIPSGHRERIVWLHRQWQHVDADVAEMLAGPNP